jgi:L-amino acid N-acyltransferase YncA
MEILRTIGRLLGGHGWRLSEQLEAQGSGPLDYPATVTVGESTLTLRPLETGDKDTILTFARTLHPHDLLFLRRDITQPEIVDAWLENVASARYETVVAVGERGEVMGYATVASDGLSWTRHVAELRVLVAVEMRGQRLGRLLTEQAFGLAKRRGVRKMMAQMTTDQRAAIQVFKRMGFRPEAKLHNQVMDRDGLLHDLQIMSLDVDVFQAKVDMLLIASRTEIPGA